VHGEHGGHGHAATLPEAEVVRRPGTVLAHPDGVEGLAHPRLEDAAAQPVVGGAEGDVVADGRHEQLVVGVLEDDAHPPPHLGERVHLAMLSRGYDGTMPALHRHQPPPHAGVVAAGPPLVAVALMIGAVAA
jgi:hypothetical protein